MFPCFVLKLANEAGDAKCVLQIPEAGKADTPVVVGCLYFMEGSRIRTTFWLWYKSCLIPVLLRKELQSYRGGCGFSFPSAQVAARWANSIGLHLQVFARLLYKTLPAVQHCSYYFLLPSFLLSNSVVEEKAWPLRFWKHSHANRRKVLCSAKLFVQLYRLSIGWQKAPEGRQHPHDLWVASEQDIQVLWIGREC